MADTGSRHGLYVVIWSEVSHWRTEKRDARRDIMAGIQPDVLLAELLAKAAELEPKGIRVRPMILDVSYGRPSA